MRKLTFLIEGDIVTNLERFKTNIKTCVQDKLGSEHSFFSVEQNDWALYLCASVSACSEVRSLSFSYIRYE